MKAFVEIANTECTFILDTAADISILKADLVDQNYLIDPSTRCIIRGVTDGTVNTVGIATTNLNFDGNILTNFPFQLVETNFPIPSDGILGKDFLNNYKCSIHFDSYVLEVRTREKVFEIPMEDTIHNQIVIPSRCEVIRKFKIDNIKEDCVIKSKELIPGVFIANSIVNKDNTYVKIVNSNSYSVTIPENPQVDFESLNDYSILNITKTKNVEDRSKEIFQKIDTDNIPINEKVKLTQLIEEFSDIFALDNEKLSENNFYQQKISVTDDTPVYIKPYRTPHSQKEEINKQVKKLLDNDLIETSTSSYNSPILLVPKKGTNSEKKWRLVVDFRQLNKQILADKFPLTRIDDILDQLGRAKWFSTLDLMSGFLQIPLDEKSRQYTAFSTENGRYQYKRLPFGLKISPNSFQRMMTIAMTGLNPEVAFLYIDDIIVIGCSTEHHLNNLRKVFERLRKYNLKLNPSKCNFFKKEVTYLGHNISDKGILPDSSKFEAIINYPVCKTADDVRRFVAFCNYYRKFIKNFAQIAAPLNKLLRKNVKFEWTEECQSSFDKLKRSLTEPNILQYPDLKQPFILTTDASDKACGAVLSQKHGEDELPIAFASKSFTKGEAHKPVIEKELTAIHWAVNHFQPYLFGTRFTIKTDHKPLTYLYTKKNPSQKLTRMRLDLDEYDFDIEFIKGQSNVCADALSRINLSSDDLKQVAIMAVQTRAMTNSSENGMANRIYEVVNPEETHNLPKLITSTSKRGKNYEINFKLTSKNRKKLIKEMTSHINPKEDLAFELMFSGLESMLWDCSPKVALTDSDPIFEIIPLPTFKEIGTKFLEKVEILIYKAPKTIEHDNEIQEILFNNHNTKIAGHPGQLKLYKKLKPFYYWKNMRQSIREYVQNCSFCQQNKTFKNPKEQLIKTDTPPQPFHTVEIDTVGPLPITNNGNRYLLSLQCEFSKYIILIPMMDKKASTIARKFVDSLFLIYGPIQSIKTDMGTEFKNEIFKDVSTFLNIEHKCSTAYHPQTIGMLERNHRTLNEYLRTFLNESKNDWDEIIQYYAFAYNTLPSIDTIFSPFELIFGKPCPMPNSVQNKPTPIYNPEHYYKELHFKLSRAYQLAQSCIEKSKKKRVNNYNVNTKPLQLAVGDLVWLENNAHHKLGNLRIGPYEVTKINTPNATIRDLKSPNKEQTVHKNRLRKYCGTTFL